MEELYNFKRRLITWQVIKHKCQVEEEFGIGSEFPIGSVMSLWDVTEQDKEHDHTCAIWESVSFLVEL